MRVQCNKFPDVVLEPAKGKKPAVVQQSCRFYAFPEGKEREKVHVDGPVDYPKVVAEFKAKGVAVSVGELKTAYANG